MSGYQESKEINGCKYTVFRLPFGIPGNPASMRGCLALIGKLVAKSGEKSDDYVELIANVVANADSSEAYKITEVLGDSTIIESESNKPQLTQEKQDLHWSEFPANFFPWVLFAAEVNFKDFFLGVTNMAKNLPQADAEGTRDLLKSLAKLTG